MDVKLLKKLADLMHQEGLNNLELVSDELSIKMERGNGGVVFERLPQLEKVKKEPVAKPKKIEKSVPVTFEIRSPLAGTYHAASVQGGIPFVSVGTHVKVGDVLCIVQDSEDTNEITSDVEGTVQAIYAKNGEQINFDQVMFRIVGVS